MSFASLAKNEIINLKVEDCCAKAEVAALIKLNGKIKITSSGIQLKFKTKSAATARRFAKLVKQAFKLKFELTKEEKGNLSNNKTYGVTIKENVKEILTELGILTDQGITHKIDDDLVKKECCKRSYLRGSFLATGSVNNPETSSYHLEIFTHHIEFASSLIQLLDGFHIKSKYFERKKGIIVYIKESEKIADFLKIIGAIHAVLTFEDTRIFRDMNNSVNRIRNCDVANLNKSWEASRQQIKNIDILIESYGIEYFDDKIIEVMELRKSYPEATLKELSEYSESGISKSGINHRLRKINKMAEVIYEKSKEND